MPPACLKCDRPFRANHQLAVLREGTRIAFDPDLGRVWRICDSCGTWNLLAATEARECLPEIAGLAAGLPTDLLDVGLARSRNSMVEILRVDLAPGATQNPGLAERHTKVSARQRRMAIAGVVGMGLLLSMPWWFGSAFPGTPGGPLRYVLGLTGTIWSSQVIASIPRSRRLGTGTGRTEFVLGSLLLLISVLAAPDTQQLGLNLSLWAMLTPANIFIQRGLPFGRTRLPSGGTVWIRRREMDDSRLHLDPEGELVLTLPDGRTLDRHDSAAVLRDLLDGYSWETTIEAQKLGTALVRHPEPLRRVMEVLRPALEADPAGMKLGQVPAAWRAALDLALAADSGIAGRLNPLAETAREAQEVADIAESLDPQRP